MNSKNKSHEVIELPQHMENFNRLGLQTQDELVKSLIRKMGLKITEQRKVIMSCLLESQKNYSERHITAQGLFERCYKKDHSIGFATVYRLLRDLSEHGLATEVRMGGHSSRYELTNKSHHDHLTCTGCGLIKEFENEKIEKLQQQVAEQFGFKLTGHILELYGLCQNCQKK